MARSQYELALAQVATTLGCEPAQVIAVMTQYREQAVIEAYDKGDKLEVIALEHGMTAAGVSKLAKRLGRKGRPNGRPRKH